MLQIVPALIVKETRDVAIAALGSALASHVLFHLRENRPLPPDTLASLVSGMQSTKPAIRRAFLSLVGDAFWELGSVSTEESQHLAKAVFPAFDASLKAVAANPLTSSTGALDGYVALGILLGPFSRSGAFGSSIKLHFYIPAIFLMSFFAVSSVEDAIARNAIVQSISATSSKPSFLLWDKVYLKINNEEEQTWLLRALTSTLMFYHKELSSNQSFRCVCSQLGYACTLPSIH